MQKTPPAGVQAGPGGSVSTTVALTNAPLRFDACTAWYASIITPDDDPRLFREFPHARSRGRWAIAARGKREAEWIRSTWGHGEVSCAGTTRRDTEMSPETKKSRHRDQPNEPVRCRRVLARERLAIASDFGTRLPSPTLGKPGLDVKGELGE